MSDLVDLIKLLGKLGLVVLVGGWLLMIGAAMVEDPCSRPWNHGCAQTAAQRDAEQRLIEECVHGGGRWDLAFEACMPMP